LHLSGKCSVHLACLQDRGSLRAEAEQLGIGEIKEYALNNFYDLNFLKQLWRLRRFIKERGIDVVHAHCFYTSIFGMTGAWLAGIPARITSKGETEGFRTPMQKRAERLAFRFAHRVIANCKVIQAQLIREGVNPKRIVQHYNGLDLERLRVRPGMRREDARVMFGLPHDLERPVITIVANLRNPVKDIPMLLRAAARVLQDTPAAAFAIAGEGSLEHDLRNQARQLGIEPNVFFTGRCDDVGSLLFASDVGVLTSKAEGFANAILEYMAAGLPVVATDVGGVREAIVEGDTGHIVPAGNDQLMAKWIIELLKNPPWARKMGQLGNESVKKFSSEYHLRNTLELYDELLGSTPRVTSLAGRDLRLSE